MKRFFAAALLLCAGVFPAGAQVPDMQAPIPADPQVRIGRLDNGLTYYIRHNAKPENQGEFYIYHDVGAMQEEESQLGLAHFLEHMAFNGTKNFPGKGLIDYLETIGVRFGENLNAGTGQEMTVYNISNVPLLREGVVDSVLLILHDWSYFLTLDPAEIDKERGVIVEEFRTRNTPSFRLREKTAPTLYSGTKYARRNVIGNMEVLKTFKPQELVDFYHRWYRTDMQAIVIVGDFDVDEMEARVKRVMADIPAVADPQPKEVVAIPENDDPQVVVASDPEQMNTSAVVYFRYEPLPEAFNDKVIAWKLNTVLGLMCDMLNYRLYEISQQPDAPFIGSGVGEGSMTNTMDVFMGVANAREGESLEAFGAMYTELEKARRFGFTETELERVKSDRMRAAEQQYDNRDDRRSAEFVQRYIDHFHRNEAIPDAGTEFRLDSVLIATTNLDEINETAWRIIGDRNQVVVVTGPEKEGAPLPSAEQFAEVIERVRHAELEAYADDTVKEPLVTAELKGAKVTKTKTDRFGATVWTLSNGATVVVKPTDFKKDEVLLNATAWGGLSSYPDADYVSGDLINTFLSFSGVGKFSEVELGKQLTGKAVSMTPTVSRYGSGYRGSASPKDLETMFQLLYLYAVEPRFEQADFDMMVDKLRAVLANARSNPDFIFSDSVNNTVFDHNPRRQVLTAERLEEADLATMERIYRALFGNASDYTFTLVGNVDLDTLRPLVEKYIGSLPASRSKSAWRNDGSQAVDGRVENRFTAAMQTPKTTVFFYLHGKLPYTMENRFAMDALAQILDIRYTESMREDKGGTYGVSVGGRTARVPADEYTLVAQFDTDPDKADELIGLILEELGKIAADGAKPEDVGKVKEYLAKQRADALKQNSAWLGWISEYYGNGLDLVGGFDRMLGTLTPDRFGDLASRVLRDGNVVKVVMDPVR